MKESILVVDDEVPLLEALRFSLEGEGYNIRTVSTGAEALTAVATHPPDLVILDVMLPDVDGLEVCRMLRAQRFRSPIILLTARDREIDQVVGLEIGADDYITKPFSTVQLVARVRAHLRRERRAIQVSDGSPPLRFGPLTVDVNRRGASMGERQIELTRREFDLLVELVRHPGRPRTRDELLEWVWGYDFDGNAHVVTATMQRLRDKLEDDPRQPRCIISVRGVGYRFDPPSSTTG